MRLIHSLDSLAMLNRPCVATVGSFDAIHVGHREIIREVKTIAEQRKLPSAVLMFEPLPREFFAEVDDVPKRIYPLRRRIERVQELEVDYLVCLSFTEDLANWTADEFIQRIVLNGLQVRHLVVGDDFRFGKNRTGDYNMLVDYATRHGFEVRRMSAIRINNIRISSTAIRDMLSEAKVRHANSMLGEPYRISGRVKCGDRLGRQLGYPTANLSFGKRRPPLNGVFVVSANVGGLNFRGIANAGIRPTVGDKQYRIETHIFDFSKEIYGERLTIYPLYRIRKERRYTNIEHLKEAIRKDIETAQSYLEAKHEIS